MKIVEILLQFKFSTAMEMKVRHVHNTFVLLLTRYCFLLVYNYLLLMFEQFVGYL